MINLARANALLDEHLKTEGLRKHSLATSLIMKALAAKFNENVEDWEILGLLHDLDLDTTRDDMNRHTLVTVEILGKEGFPPEYLKAIKAHNEMTGVPRGTRLEHALAAAESITGLIAACALVLPDKKISSIKPSSIRKRMKEKAFAKNVSRESIMECEKIGLTLDEFIEISLGAMKVMDH